MEIPTRIKNKPTIIAICGKSATGKDTLVRILMNSVSSFGLDVNIIVSDTTRPQRINEINGVDYNFIPRKLFMYKIDHQEYLEYARFNNWLYGTNKRSISDTAINIGVFNVSGITNLIKYISDYNIICIYLKCPFYRRLLRSIQRENKIKMEFFRRARVDKKDFKNINHILRHFSDFLIIDTNKKSPATINNSVVRKLKINKIIPYNKT